MIHNTPADARKYFAYNGFVFFIHHGSWFEYSIKHDFSAGLCSFVKSYLKIYSVSKMEQSKKNKQTNKQNKTKINIKKN